ncbi:MAG: GntR family transcriptional regulator [Acidobacteria bacterium]|nr:MAG: GntR family transcriptional regulator [Acidobacteriota bacterium]
MAAIQEAQSPGPKYRQVYAALWQEIQSGHWKSGERLPSEADLVRKFGASRITIGRAVRDLQAAGLVERRAGSGTFVKKPVIAPGMSFSLLIPDLGETEIFEPICQGMMGSSLAREHALLWGSVARDGASKEDRAWQLCRQYIDRRVAGVFFAPLELTAGKDEVNSRIAQALDEAHIPIVLLDRTVLPYPRRGRHDLVGIDNRRAGYVITEHLLRLGSRRIAFVALAHAAATVDAREAGYREALYAWNAPVEHALVSRLDPSDRAAVEAMMAASRPDAIVCANDRTAGRLMQTLLRLNHAVPGDVRLVGIDDAEYAKLLPVPLTTLRQPTREIGDAALTTMLERLVRPDRPARDVLLHTELVIRESCGARNLSIEGIGGEPKNPKEQNHLK